MAALSFALFVGTLVLWLLGAIALEGWMWAALGFLFLWNVQFLSLAILGEYIVRTHRHSQRRPLYVVDSVIENANTARYVQKPFDAEMEATLLCHPSALCEIQE
jgi:hypothetical protein